MLKFICFNLRFNTLNAIHIIIMGSDHFNRSILGKCGFITSLKFKICSHTGNELNRFRKAQDTP